MKSFFLLTFLLIVSSISAVAQWDAWDDPDVKPSDPVMRQAIGRIAKWYIKPSNRSRTVYVSGDRMKSEWLPVIPNIKFKVIGREDAGERTGYVLIGVRKSGKDLLIDFGSGDLGCGQIFYDTWAFQVGRSEKIKSLRIVVYRAGIGCHASP